MIGEPERDAWLRHMLAALESVTGERGTPPELVGPDPGPPRQRGRLPRQRPLTSAARFAPWRSLPVTRPRDHAARPDGREGPAEGLQGPQGARVLLPEGRHARLHHAGLRPARHRSATSATPRCSASAPTSRPSRRSSTTSTASASRCWPTRTTPSPRPTACGARRRCTARSTWGSSARRSCRREGQDRRGLAQGQPEGHPGQPAQGPWPG